MSVCFGASVGNSCLHLSLLVCFEHGCIHPGSRHTRLNNSSLPKPGTAPCWKNSTGYSTWLPCGDLVLKLFLVQWMHILQFVWTHLMLSRTFLPLGFVDGDRGWSELYFTAVKGHRYKERGSDLVCPPLPWALAKPSSRQR